MTAIFLQFTSKGLTRNIFYANAGETADSVLTALAYAMEPMAEIPRKTVH